MKRLGFCSALLVGLASMMSAHSAAPPVPAPAVSGKPRPVPAHAPAPPTAVPKAPSTFEDYCVECHGADKPKANINLEKLLAQPTADSVGANWKDWERVTEMLESGAMPPKEATLFPTDAERSAGLTWIRTSLDAYEAEHAGDPGRVTVRRLTSAEYAYAVRDLTGIDIKAGIDASSDSVGGEGFANFGDVQFMQDASVERYLEAAKLVADHAVVGAGPLEFYSDPGKTGLELSALSRIDGLYASRGFRVVSGEGGFPYGLDRYGKAFYVAWFYKHRAALGEPAATLRSLAAREGITGRFAEHIWAVVNRPVTGYPTRTTVEGWKKLPSPTSDIPASIAVARTGTDALYKALTTWPSWFFARGDLAAGGAGDESPLRFDDTSLKAEPGHHFTYALGPRGGRGRGAPAPVGGPVKVSLIVTSLETMPDAKPVVIWRNARVVTRAAATTGRGTPPTTTPAPPAGRGPAGPVLATRSLRSVLPAEIAASLKFGIGPDGAALGPDDFATTDTTSFSIDPPAAGTSAELQADAELGPDRNAVMRVMISDRPEGSSRDAGQRVLIGDPASAGYRTFRAGMAEYVSLLPPNSHGEANPADKDPVPPPFDNTYNSPEHDAFVLKVKYQRSDDFFASNIVDGEDRARLNQAWNDLFGSWPYHDAYLGMLADHYGLALKSRLIKDMGPAQIAALPAAVRPHVKALRAHYDGVVRAQTLAEPGHLAGVLEFGGRAWRRPLTAADKAGLRAFYDKSRVENRLDHDGAIRAVLARILVAPAFLYRLETVARVPDKPLSGSELASRMSFFLWSSIPDDELRRAAAAGELNDPVKLAEQVKRMTADPKARRLATEFFGQWLGFYHFDEYRGVDTGRFPEFTEDVRTAMHDEAVSTFEYLVREERPVREILYADYTFLNKTLANFYGIKKELGTSGRMERVEGVREFDRGGALRLGSVLTVTSAPLRTSPVKRGDWVLRRILGTPTPPPPADAGTLPADDKTFEGLTLRQKLTQHKRNATCASCHLRIDPLGFPLEGFDAVGRTRDKYADGNPVDVTGEFADKTTIAGTEGLLTYLQSQDRKVMTTLARKMMGYALGRTALASDQPLVREMVAAGGSASFSDLATKIVTSRQFRHRAGDSAAVPPSSVSDVENRPPQ